ncbi:glycosyltransferase [Kangiella sp. HZ709]|uniref:glycosyltransferase n=1 Tax=Kangiella sp. HZ709 TaxID=2666328 RepID=UPI0012B08241|nr:glycosyltransferase [Kangiella sp. HZ709]MRX27152.1 glycosyltransferase [Kangiella sp. HZ709]
MKKILLLRTSSKPIPRVKRMALVAEELGFETLFVGAYRDEGLDEKDEWDGLKVKRVGKYYPMLNGAGLFTYLKGVIRYNIGAYKTLKKERPEVIHFSDVESFFAVFVYGLFNKISTLYNIHDNFGQRYPLPSFFNKILNFFEGLIVKYATSTLVPEQFRADALPAFCRSKITVIKNTPVDPGQQKHSGLNCSKIKVVFAGWLDEGRGIGTLLDIANNNDNYEVHIAGEGSPDIMAKIAEHKNCIYHGFLNHYQVLDLTAQCDFVFAHYSPHRIINIFAAPNKLAESLAVGRPVIINSEAKVSQPVESVGCGVVTAYGDAEAIVETISTICSEPSSYLDMCQKARTLFEDSYSWEKVKAETIQVFKNL